MNPTIASKRGALFFSMAFGAGCAAATDPRPPAKDSLAATPTPIAFPGAEGFGRFAIGGRGGEVYEVTNLNDSGPGSLRDAVSKPHRTVVFRVSGTIELKTRLTIEQPFVTVAGQTAPGDGICLRGKELFIRNTHDVIVRFIRSRPGDELKQEHDALTIWNAKDVIIDHCSMSWSTDSLNDVVKGSGRVTVQWCILSEPLNESVHFKGSHGYGTGWDGRIITKEDGTIEGGGGSYHHNLLAHCNSRSPRVGYFNQGRGLIDVRNNVIYNWGKLSGYGGEGDDLNFVGNYFRPGPSTKQLGSFFQVWKDDSRLFISGNVFDGDEAITRDNRKGVTFGAAATQTSTGLDEVLVAKPFDASGMPPAASGESIVEPVLKSAGAVLPKRDAVDDRIIADFGNRTGKLVNSQTDVGGWPMLKSSPAPVDTDHDGMPDDWETAHKLDPTNPADRNTIPDRAGGYTNLEIYLNEFTAN